MKKANNNEVIDMFGLTPKQTQLMFSTQKLIAQHDIKLSQGTKPCKIKRDWLKNWEESIINYMDTMFEMQDSKLLPAKELIDEFVSEYNESPSKIWYYIVVLECLEFHPYTSLGNEEKDKQYLKLKYNKKETAKYITSFFKKQKFISEEKIQRLSKVYQKSIDEISGKAKSITIKILAVIGVAAVCAALVAVGAGPIAVAIFGKGFEGLAGAALTSACLAAAGGGAVAIGGLGIAGGVAILAGGGALLGLAGAGTVTAVASIVMLKSPDYTLTQAAKLETILKEVVLNVQQDVVCAQTIIEKYREQIDELNKKLTEMETQAEVTKKELKNIKESIKYMTKSCKGMAVFTSCYEEGMKYTA